ncbi:MAG: 2-iminoacetate synthase ThiH [Acidobacteria bacterium]|nr:MAG: 2-iminoacetate synthase ThiH [Acidobacteriota bacterium]
MPGGYSAAIDESAVKDAAHLSAHASARDVETALGRDSRDIWDLAALLSPVAGAEYLESIAERSRELTRQRFGKTIHLFAPLYVSNACVSTCTYCGFSKSNEIARTTLEPDEVRVEAGYLLDQGFRHILLVSGEHARIVSPDYLCEVIDALAPSVPQISLEVQTWSATEYERFVAAGADGIVVYQETYDRQRYSEVHLRGRKRDYDARLDALDHAASAGARRLGAGALLGLLPDWRADVISLAEHALWLTRKHWRCEISVALPRLRPCIGSEAEVSPVGDRDYLQAICALRLLLPDAAIVLTTREPARLRDGLMQVGVTHMSAGSHTEPGGYTLGHLGADPQFDVDDRRPVSEVANAIAENGYDPVWKDWARV